MKRLANILMVLGAIVAIIAFNLDVTGGDGRIVNMNLMAQRQNLLIIGCVGFLAGIVLLVGVQRQAGPINGTHPERQDTAATPPPSKAKASWGDFKESAVTFFNSLRKDTPPADFIARLFCGIASAIVGANVVDAILGPMNIAMYMLPAMLIFGVSSENVALCAPGKGLKTLPSRRSRQAAHSRRA